MAVSYFYRRDDQQFGPVTVEQFKELGASGQLQAIDLIQKEGTTDWIPAARFKGLIPAPPDEDEYTVAPPHPKPEITFIPPPRPAAEAEEPHDTTQAEIAARQAKDAAMAASSDALKAFKVLAKNPVGGMREAFESLGPTRAMAVGVVFLVTYYVGLVSGEWLQIHDKLISLLFFGVVPPLFAFGGCVLVRKIFKGGVNLQCDTFIAGASMLPYGLGILAMGVLAGTSAIAQDASMAFATTTTALMLYSGCTTTARHPRSKPRHWLSH